MEANWNTYVEVPKRINFKSLLKKRCLELNLSCNITSDSIHRSTFDKLIGVNREVIYFNISGDYSNLKNLKREIEVFANKKLKTNKI